MDDHATGRRTALPRGTEASPDASFDRQLQLCIVHDDDDVLAAHLEMDVLEAGRSILIDEPADVRGSSERDDFDRFVGRQLRADVGAAGDQIHYAGWNAGFLENPDKVHR